MTLIKLEYNFILDVVPSEQKLMSLVTKKILSVLNTNNLSCNMII